MSRKSEVPLSAVHTVPLHKVISERCEQEGETKTTVPELPDRYVLQRKLGEGGCAHVYSAYDRVVGRLVAVKWLPFDKAAEMGVSALDLFQAETRIMGKLSHPHILSLYDCGVAATGCFLVLEYCQGQNLFSIVQSRGRLSPDFALPIIFAVADCVAYAHRKGVVHGDITPCNVFVSWDGMTKLLDFGLAGYRSAFSAARLGTPAFAAPEVVQNGAITTASDVFSLGATAVFALTGEIPQSDYAEEGAEQVARKWQLLAERHIEDGQLRDWLILALKSNPAQRPSVQKWRDTMPTASKNLAQPLSMIHIADPTEKALPPSNPTWSQEPQQAECLLNQHSRESSAKWKRLWQAAAVFVGRIPASRMLFAVEAGTAAYRLHNVSVAGNVLFPVFSERIRQVLALVIGAIAFVNLRLSLFILIWSFLPILLSEVVGWAIAYGALALICLPVVQLFPHVSLQVLVFPIASALSTGLAVSLLVGRWLGPAVGVVVGICGRFLTNFLTGIARSPFMDNVLQYGLLTAGPQWGIVASIRDGVIPAVRYSLSWPQVGYILISGVAGVLAGAWRPKKLVEFLLHSSAVGVTLALLPFVLGLSNPWEEILVSLLVYLAVGLGQILGTDYLRPICSE